MCKSSFEYDLLRRDLRVFDVHKWKVAKKKTSSCEFLVIRTNTRVADQQPSQAFIPKTYLCLLICLHQHIVPPIPLPRGSACLMSADKNVLSLTKLVQALCRKGPFGRLTSSSACNVVPLLELPVENNKHPNFECREGGGVWIEKTV